jgi:uncharacterized membrane protein
MSEQPRHGSRSRLAERLPADLAVVVGLALLATGLLLWPSGGPLVRLVGSLPLFVFLPGYAIVAALFPEEGESVSRGGDRHGLGVFDRTVTPLERLAYAVGTSIVVVPLAALAVDVALSGLSVYPVALSLSGITVGAAVVAGGRRAALPPERRFRVPYS